MSKTVRALVLAAGKGTRMKSSLPKVLHPISGVPLIEITLEALDRAGFHDQWVVIGFGRKLLEAQLKGRVKLITQEPQLGTGHAVLVAERALKGYTGNILVLAGDVPLIRPETLKKLLAKHIEDQNACSCLSMNVEDPTHYGRIVRDVLKSFKAIREELEANDLERQIREVNTGIYIFQYPKLREAVRELKPSAKKKELYLTDAVELLAAKGERVAAYPFGLEWETQGVNTRAELSRLEERVNLSNISALQSQGVTVMMPSQTYIQKGVKIGEGTMIHPFVWIEKGVEIGKSCTIGPFAKLRAGTRVQDHVTIGSFVELVRSRVGSKTQIKHLSYFGDAQIGSGVNVGAGTITANYDGKNKNVTQIGNGSFLGVHTSLVAPVSLGEKVKTGAGAVVTARQRIKGHTVIVGVPARELQKRKKK
jgi:bifunctional UDP-N-acetylglucosamine pyrophosphorylase/glucosamine-1-phosphate N-acetyltransferase